MRRLAAATVLLIAGLAAGQQPAKTENRPSRRAVPIPKASPDEKAVLLRTAAEIRNILAGIPGGGNRGLDEQLLHADVEIFAKAIEYMLEFDEYYLPESLEMLRFVAVKGRERARQLAAGSHPWTAAEGRVVRAYRSPIDGSIQPYVLAIPAGSRRKPLEKTRLDVVLHGRNGNLNETWFIAKNEGKPPPVDLEHLELHVYGRGNNAYRWCGEEDVHDAIEIVADRYGVDRRRIVLRGFSMGGAGSWHLGLHHPTKWASVEAGAGFTDTLSKIRLGPLPEHQMRGLRIYDAIEYALNAGNVPIICYGGEDDPQIAAPRMIVERLQSLGFAMTTDGLRTTCPGLSFEFLVGAKMGHRVDAVSAAAMRAFHNRTQEAILKRPAESAAALPSRFQAETCTARFPAVAPGVRIERLEKELERATVRGAFADGLLELTTANAAELRVTSPAVRQVRIDGADFTIPRTGSGPPPAPGAWFEKTKAGWRPIPSPAAASASPMVKRHGLQGPIDDAFTGPFLCVRGTGEPWSRAVHDWSMERLKRFADEWKRHFRGEIRVKDDVDFKPRDAFVYNIALFGDPGSNRVLARLLDRLPVQWSKERLRMVGEFPTASHVPAFIFPNPDNPGRCLVVNSGHTFGGDDFQGTNALLFPRLGDRAVIRIGDGDRTVEAGFFDERWRLP